MKKIYTLFAFAALCVSGCTNDITEGGNISSKYNTVTLEALAHTDESRALVNDELNGFIWNFEEESDIAVLELVDNECGENGTLNEDYTASHNRVARGAFNSSKSDSGAGLAVFDVTLKSDNKKDVARSYLVAYPYSALGKFCQGNNHCAEMTIPEVQKPCKECHKSINSGTTTVYNIDPEATVMFAVDKNLGSDDQTQTTHPYQLDLNFDHVASYARLRIYGLNLMTKGTKLTGDGHASEELVNPEVVDHIVFETLDENEYLAGVWKFDFSDKEVLVGDKMKRHTESAPCTDRCSNRITLDVKHLGITATGQALDFALYFAAMPVNIENGFTVTVVTTEGHIYKRTVSTGKLSFERATVKNFSVSFNNIEPEDAVYLKAYKKLYGMPAGGFDSQKDYVIATQTFDNTYTLNNTKEVKEDETCSADNVETSGFVVITEGDDDRTYLLHQDVSQAGEYVWNISGSGNRYSISHNGYYWYSYFGGVNSYKDDLALISGSGTTWSFSYNNELDFNIFNADNINHYVYLTNSSTPYWKIGINATSSKIDIYEDCGYYWNPESDDNDEPEDLPDIFYKSYTDDSYTTLNRYLKAAPGTYIITTKIGGVTYIIGGSNNDELNKVTTLEEAEFSFVEGSNENRIKCKKDIKYAFRCDMSSTMNWDHLYNAAASGYLTVSSNQLYFNSARENYVTNNRCRFKSASKNDYNYRLCVGSDSRCVYKSGDSWTVGGTDLSSGDIFKVYVKEE